MARPLSPVTTVLSMALRAALLNLGVLGVVLGYDWGLNWLIWAACAALGLFSSWNPMVNAIIAERLPEPTQRHTANRTEKPS